MEKDLNICLVGTGWIGKSHILRINSRLKGGKVVAVSDVNSAAGKAAARSPLSASSTATASGS